MRDDGEFVAFVESSGSRLCETAFLLCRDWNFAQDLTQVTFIKVYLSWRRIRHDDPYRYSKKVLLRAYLDHKRLKSSAELRTDAVPDRAVADAAELRLTLLDALGQLSPRDRAIIILRWEDHSIQTVSPAAEYGTAVVVLAAVGPCSRYRHGQPRSGLAELLVLAKGSSMPSHHAANLRAGAIVGDMSEVPLGDESGEVAAANVDGNAKLDDEAQAEAEVEAQLDAEAEAEAEVEPEAEGEL